MSLPANSLIRLPDTQQIPQRKHHVCALSLWLISCVYHAADISKYLPTVGSP